MAMPVFGREPKRRVVEAGVLKAAMGYEMGSTLTGILLEHGLIRSVKNRKSTVPELTRKGQDYLRAMTFNVGFHKVLQLLSPSDPETEA